MTSSQPTSFLSEIASGDVIPRGKLAYFQQRQRNRIYDFILTRFQEKERAGALTKADLARRIGRKPEQVTRWLGAPGNWTLDTISDLLLAICAEELAVSGMSLFNRPARNATQPGWLSATQPVIERRQEELPRTQSDAQAISAGLVAAPKAAA